MPTKNSLHFWNSVDGPAHGWRQRDQDHLGALAADPQHPVLVLVAEVGGGGLEDPQAQQAGHGHQHVVARVRRLPGGGEQGLGLHVREPQGR